MPQTTSKAYRPNPEHVTIRLPETWSIELSSDATIVELAILVAAFNCRAELVTADAINLTPIDPHAPTPTGAQIVALFEQGLASIPTSVRLRCRPEVAPVIEIEA